MAKAGKTLPPVPTLRDWPSVSPHAASAPDPDKWLPDAFRCPSKTAGAVWPPSAGTHVRPLSPAASSSAVPIEEALPGTSTLSRSSRAASVTV
jgi:hypothetical protein